MFRMSAEKWVSLVLWVLAAQLIGVVGTFFTTAAIPEWYTFLAKPLLSPPNWIFAPVWITLYTLMGIAAWRIWERHSLPGGWRALTTYILQLVLNGIWTPIFFGLRDPQLGLIVIGALLCMIMVTMYRFARIDKVAAYLLVPYLLWVGFATYLNAMIVVLN